MSSAHQLSVHQSFLFIAVLPYIHTYIFLPAGVWYHVPYFCTVVSFHFWLFLATLLLRHAYRQVSLSDGRQSEKNGEEKDAAKGRGRSERFLDGKERRNEEERHKKKKVEKYGDAFNQKMVSGVAGYVGEGEKRKKLDRALEGY